MEIETRGRFVSPIKYYKEYYILQISYILRCISYLTISCTCINIRSLLTTDTFRSLNNATSTPWLENFTRLRLYMLIAFCIFYILQSLTNARVSAV